MLKKQQLKLLQQGNLKCSNCSFVLHLADYEELEVATCPECMAPVFIPLKLKNYYLYSPLGGGGMGSVYKAVHELTFEYFAIKILPRQHRNNPSMKSDLLLEGEIGSIIGTAPNIVDVVDYGEDNDETFIAFPFVQGTRLDIFVSSSESLSEKLALDILLQIIEAELHIVNCGFLYRDIKPENIIIVEQTSTAKLLDFGLTLPLSQAQTPDEADLLEGSPYYLPPERIVSAPEGEHSEVYSLGMLLFFMVAGTTYFSKSDVQQIIGKHIRAVRIATVANRLKQCSPEFCQLVDKMIKRNPNERFRNLTDLKEAIQEVYKDASGYTLQQNRKTVLANKASSILTGGIANRHIQKSVKDRILTIIVIICFVLIGVISVSVMYNRYQARQREAIKVEIARQLDIPPDIPPPEKSIDSVEKIVKMNFKELMLDFNKAHPKFDKKKAEIKFATQYGFNPKHIKSPTIKEEDFEKVIQAEIDKKIKQESSRLLTDVSKDDLREKVARDLNIKLPCEPPKKIIDEINEQLKHDALKKAAGKFSVAKEKHAVQKRLKSLKLYKEGEIITIKDKNENEMTGIFKGRIANNILLGGNKVPFSSLPYETQVKFDKKLCEAERTSARKTVHDEFEKKRADFIENYIKQNKEKLYKQYGYVKIQKHSFIQWVPASEILEAKLKHEMKKNVENKSTATRYLKKKIIEDFDKDKFIKNLGFVKYNGGWISQRALLDLLVKREKKKYDADVAEKLKVLKNEFKNTEKDIYFENNYLKTADGWRPANEVLEDELSKIYH